MLGVELKSSNAEATTLHKPEAIQEIVVLPKAFKARLLCVFLSLGPKP